MKQTINRKNLQSFYNFRSSPVMTSSLVPNNKSKQLLDKQYASEPTLFSANKVIHTNPLLLNTHSLPNLTSSSSLVDVTEDYVFSRQDLTAAAEILINIVNESQFILSTSQFKKTLKKNLAVSDRVLSLVYGTMKCKKICRSPEFF